MSTQAPAGSTSTTRFADREAVAPPGLLTCRCQVPCVPHIIVGSPCCRQLPYLHLEYLPRVPEPIDRPALRRRRARMCGCPRSSTRSGPQTAELAAEATPQVCGGRCIMYVCSAQDCIWEEGMAQPRVVWLSLHAACRVLHLSPLWHLSPIVHLSRPCCILPSSCRHRAVRWRRAECRAAEGR